MAEYSRISNQSARPRSPGSCALGFLLALCLLGTREASAQARLRTTLHVGGWLPMGVVHEDLQNGALVKRAQVGDILVGGRVGWAVGHGLAAELTLSLSPGQVARTDASGTADIPGMAMLAAVRITRQGRLNDGFDGHLAAGAGVLRRSGRGWAGAHVVPALVGGFGLETDFVSGTAFTMEVELYGSRGRRASSVSLGQNAAWRGDLVLSFGVVFSSSRS